MISGGEFPFQRARIATGIKGAETSVAQIVMENRPRRRGRCQLRVRRSTNDRGQYREGGESENRHRAETSPPPGALYASIPDSSDGLRIHSTPLQKVDFGRFSGHPRAASLAQVFKALGGVPSG